MSSHRSIRLSGRAARYLAMLADFGHLDPGQAEDVLIELADRYGACTRERVVDLPEVRPVVASKLFDSNPDAPASTGPLGEDWASLFF